MDFFKACLVYTVMAIVIGAAVLIGMHKPNFFTLSLFPLCVVGYAVAFGVFACSGEH